MSGRGAMLLAYPFRLFFVLAGVYATVAVVVWLCLLLGGHVWKGPVSPAIWHGHEMLFGYTLAVIAGFVLTAVSNWTQTPPWRKAPLAALAGVWLAGRLAFGFAPWLPPWLVAVVDLLFVPMLAVFLAIPIITTGNRRQTMLMALIAGLFAANLLVHLEALGILAEGGHVGLMLAVDLVMGLIAVMGGRVIPMFTGNALRQRGIAVLPISRPWLEHAAVPALLAVAALDVTAEYSLAAGIVSLVAAALHGLRLGGWRGERTLDQPIVWVLHLGYGWLVIGLTLKGLAVLAPDWLPPSAALHALTIGAIGTLSVGIMSRVSLGHTGRAFKVSRLTTAVYALVAGAALVRVAGPACFPASTDSAVTIAAGLWIGAFVLFILGHLGMLTEPRADGRPG